MVRKLEEQLKRRPTRATQVLHPREAGLKYVDLDNIDLSLALYQKATRLTLTTPREWWMEAKPST